MGSLKGKSLLMILYYANLKYYFYNCNFWLIGYYISIVGLNEVTIKSIYKSWKKDILHDKIGKNYDVH